MTQDGFVGLCCTNLESSFPSVEWLCRANPESSFPSDESSKLDGAGHSERSGLLRAAFDERLQRSAQQVRVIVAVGVALFDHSAFVTFNQLNLNWQGGGVWLEFGKQHSTGFNEPPLFC